MDNKASNILAKAFIYLEEAEHPNATIKPDMKHYWMQRGNQTYACLGGLYSLREYGFINSYALGNYGTFDQDKFKEATNIQYAINQARQGNASGMFYFLGLNIGSAYKLSRPITDYHKDPEAFKKEFQLFINDLINNGF